MSVVGATTNEGAALTVRVAVRVWAWPVSVANVMVYGPEVPTPRLFALALTVNVTFVPMVDAVPEVEDRVSQFGYPEIE